MQKLVYLLLSLWLAVACTKTEGQGGTSTIIGLVTTQDFNGAGELIATFPAADQDVFIIYGGDNTFHNDDIATSYDGSFQFTNLTPGDYQLFVYSQCNLCPSGEEVVLNNVTISKKGEVVNVGEIIRND